MNTLLRSVAAIPGTVRLRVAYAVVGCVLASLGSMGGCAGQSPLGGGVTVGGQEDIAAARQAITDGEIPDPVSITPEGFLSEHSIPLTSPPGDGLLFTEAAVAWSRPFDAFSPLATVRIGLGSSVDPAAYSRPALNLCLLIDRSGSMADPIDERSGTTKLEAVRIAVDRILANLVAEDRVSIVTFNAGSQVLVEDAAGDDVTTIKNALATIVPEGDTNLAAGLQGGFAALDRHDAESRADRLLVFTDAELRLAQEERVQAFLRVMNQYAALDFGTTLFGVGSAFGHEVAYEISQVRGGNYFFLSDYDRIVDVFDNEFRFFVAPIAYDAALSISVPYSFDIAGVYGIPFEGNLANQVAFRIPSLFLSSREGGGAILLRVRAGALVDFGQSNTVADVSLSYETRLGTMETAPTVRATLPERLDPQADAAYYQDDSTKRAVLLLDTALALHNAAEDAYQQCTYYSDYFGSYYGGYYSCGDANDPQRAALRLGEFLVYFDEMSAGLEDSASPTSRTLSQERTLVRQLLDNIEAELRPSGN